MSRCCCRLFGCYEALDGGGLEEALVDFTGGVAETIELQTGEYHDEASRMKLFDVLKREIRNKSLAAAAIPVSLSVEHDLKIQRLVALLNIDLTIAVVAKTTSDYLFPTAQVSLLFSFYSAAWLSYSILRSSQA